MTTSSGTHVATLAIVSLLAAAAFAQGTQRAAAVGDRASLVRAVRIMRNIDKNGNGTLEKSENAAAWRRYRRLDANRDGVISIEELCMQRARYLGTGGVRQLDIVYKRTSQGEWKLDLYYPTKKDAVPPYPVVVYTHGGGWAAGSKQGIANGSFKDVFQELLDRGFAAASVDSRLCRPDSGVTMRDCVTDCKDAARYLVKNCDTLKLDPDRFFVMGVSAGGHIAQMLLFSSPDSFSGDPELAGAAYKMVAGVSWHGPCNFERMDLFNCDDRPDFRDRFAGRILKPDTPSENFRVPLIAVVVFGTAHLLGDDHQALVAAASHTGQAKVFNITSYGAVGDGVAMDTGAIQHAIDACHEAGGGIVRVPPGDFQIGTIRLKSNVTLSLDYGASMLGSRDIADYPTEALDDPREGGPHCLIYAKDAINITIEGLGVIDGRGTRESFPRIRRQGREISQRPRLLRMVNCAHLTFSNVTYKRPAFWGLHLIDCRDIHFNSVTIRFRNNNYNNDGIDLDGCENVLIENCDIHSGDDAICLKSSLNPCRHVVVRNCRVSSDTAALKCGTSSRGGFIDVAVRNCYFYDSPMGAIKLLVVDGGRMENVGISRIVMENVGCPLFIRLGARGRTYSNKARPEHQTDGHSGKAPVGTVKRVHIRDVVATVTLEDPARAAQATYKHLKSKPSPGITDQVKSKAGPIMITGIPGHYVENVVLENITISYPGGGSQKDAERVVPEDVARYPEQFFFGVLPAWGAHIRHARNIEFRNVVMQTRSTDARKKIVLDDVDGFVER